MALPYYDQCLNAMKTGEKGSTLRLTSKGPFATACRWQALRWLRSTASLRESQTKDRGPKTGLPSPVFRHSSAPRIWNLFDRIQCRVFQPLVKIQSSGLSNERGVALVIVLWIFIFLFVVAFEFSASVREEGMATHRYSQEVEGYYLALAGFEQELYHLVREPILNEEGQAENPGVRLAEVADGTWRERRFGDGLYRVRVVDEGGKIDLNRAKEGTLRRIFINLGVEGSRADMLVDSILDWRDSDDLHRLNGAESDYYLSLSPPYTARNGPFDTVEDLLWVNGITPELFYSGGDQDQGRFYQVGLREVFTVDSPMDRVNLRTASAEVIHALIGLPLEQSRAFVQERGELSEE